MTKKVANQFLDRFSFNHDLAMFITCKHVSVRLLRLKLSYPRVITNARSGRRYV